MTLLGKYSAAARESMLDIAAAAALAGHDLAGFEPVEDGDGDPHGYQAACRRCNGTAWVGANGVMYSLLADQCSGP